MNFVVTVSRKIGRLQATKAPSTVMADCRRTLPGDVPVVLITDIAEKAGGLCSGDLRTGWKRRFSFMKHWAGSKINRHWLRRGHFHDWSQGSCRGVFGRVSRANANAGTMHRCMGRLLIGGIERPIMQTLQRFPPRHLLTRRS